MPHYRYRPSFRTGIQKPGSSFFSLIIAMGAVFFLQILAPGITSAFALNPRVALPELKLYQLVTYIFLHGGFFHIFINVFVLYMFGRELEDLWGGGRFLLYFFVSGIGAGLITALLSNYPVVGASGAIYGLLLAFGVLFPNRLILLWFVIPIKAKYLVIIFGALEFFASMRSGGDGISHITHLGGMIFGGILLAIWHLGKTHSKKRQSSYLDDLTGGSSSPGNVDRILDKVLREGPDSLSEDERNILKRAGRFYSSKNQD